MSANNTLLTMTVTSSQAACISDWLQKCNIASPHRATADVLAALAVQLDDARWIGRWLREEARLALRSSEVAAIRHAIAEGMKLTESSEQEVLALTRLLTHLDRTSHAGTLQFACPQPLAYSDASTDM